MFTPGSLVSIRDVAPPPLAVGLNCSGNEDMLLECPRSEGASRECLGREVACVAEPVPGTLPVCAVMLRVLARMFGSDL